MLALSLHSIRLRECPQGDIVASIDDARNIPRIGQAAVTSPSQGRWPPDVAAGEERSPAGDVTGRMGEARSTSKGTETNDYFRNSRCLTWIV